MTLYIIWLHTTNNFQLVVPHHDGSMTFFWSSYLPEYCPALFSVTRILLVLNAFSYVFTMQPKRKQDRKNKRYTG